MQTYLVGGAVRDFLIGQPAHDRDYVLVNANQVDIAGLMALGYRQVGKDFPVFLSPTGEEYALARVERKTGSGHKGFSFTTEKVSLEEDLSRRDLTINAMAQDIKTGEIMDFYGGQRDLQAGVLRHVSEAFAEDPLRVLRVARFSARYPNFKVAPETLQLMTDISARGDLLQLSAERVWMETVKAMNTPEPRRYFEVLKEVGALDVWFPELAALDGIPQPLEHHPEGDVWTHTLMVLDQVKEGTVGEKLAAVFHDIGKGLTPPNEWPQHIDHENTGAQLLETVKFRLKIPNAEFRLMQAVAEQHLRVHQVLAIRKPGRLLALLLAIGGGRAEQESFFLSVLKVCQADAQGRLGRENVPYPQAEFLKEARAVLLGVKHSQEYVELVESGITGKDFADKLVRIQLAKLQSYMRNRTRNSDLVLM